MKLRNPSLFRYAMKRLLPGLLVGGLGLLNGGCSSQDEAPRPVMPSDGGNGGAPSTNPSQGGRGDPDDFPGPSSLEPDSSEPDDPSTEVPESMLEAPESPTDDPTRPSAGAVDWADGLWLVNSPNVSITSGTQIGVDLSAAVSVVAQEKLIAFVETHSPLFTEVQRDALTKHAYFTERGHGAGLLIGMLGLVLEDDFGYFSANPSAPMRADTEAEAKFLEALAALDEQPYTLQGRQEALATSSVPSRPRLLAHVTRLLFPNGKKLRAIDTRLHVTDQNGGRGAVGLKGQHPLVLASEGMNPEPLQVEHRYGTVFTGAAELEAGASITVQISKQVNGVSHARLVEWFTEHPRLFTDAEKMAITSEPAFTDEAAAPELLHGMLGVKLGGSFQFFARVSKIQIEAFTPADQQWVAALSELQNQSLVLSGTHTATNIGSFGAAPHVFVRTTRVDLPGGHWLRVVGTHPEAADSGGSREKIQSESGSTPLELRTD